MVGGALKKKKKRGRKKTKKRKGEGGGGGGGGEFSEVSPSFIMRPKAHLMSLLDVLSKSKGVWSSTFFD